MMRAGQTGADDGISREDDAVLYWLARHRLKLMTRRDEAAFEIWLSDPANALSYRNAEAGITNFGAIASDEEVRRMREAALAMGAARSRVSVPLRLIAATVAVAMAGAWFTVLQPASDRPAPVSIAASDDTLPVAAASRRYVTKIGERSRFALDDGSTVSLNTNSILEVAFTPGKRNVRLVQGEGLFQVAKNKDRPFIVTAGNLRTTAIGTAFDVRVDRGRVRIVLTAGRVVVDSVRPAGVSGRLPAMEPISLQPGEQLATDENHAVIVSAADVEQVTSWRQGQLIFRDEPLSSALAEMNRYTRDQIIVQDPKVANLRVSGVFSTARPENFLAAMTAFYPLEVRRPSQGAVILDWSEAKSDH